MNSIPALRFIFSVVIGGFMFYIYGNLMDMLIPHFSVSGSSYIVISAIWHGIPLFVIFKNGIEMLMAYQKRQFI